LPEIQKKEIAGKKNLKYIFVQDMPLTFAAMYKTCFHLHTHFSDGSGSPEDFVEEALAEGFTHLGFSDHAPVPFENPWSLASAESDAYLAITEPLRNIYHTTLKVFRGLEADYIPGISYPFKQLREEYDTDYLIGSVHLVRPETGNALWFIDGSVEQEYFSGLTDLFGNDVKKAVSAFYHQQMEMVVNEKPDVLGHFDKITMHNKGRVFQEDEPWIVALQNELLELVKAHQVVVEVNTRGLYKGRHHTTYPSPALIRRCVELDIPLILSSDAHKPSEISGYYPQTMAMLEELGVKSLCVFENRHFTPVSIGEFLN